MIEDSPAPERVWKYREWTDYARAMIERNEIYFASVEQLNDCFEFRWKEKYPTDPKEQRAFLDALCRQRFPSNSNAEIKAKRELLWTELRALVRENPDGVCRNAHKFDQGVFCASGTNSCEVMWSHYAANHSGACIGIRTDRAKVFKEVHYASKTPVISVWEYVHGDDSTFTELVLTKKSSWSYEQEWRTLDSPGLYTMEGAVDQIVIGAKATPDTRREILESAGRASQKVTVYQATIDDKQNAIVILPL